MARTRPPQLDPAELRRLLELWGRSDAGIQPLDSYLDLNFRVSGADGDAVLKVAHPDVPEHRLAAENALLRSAREGGLPVPELIPTDDHRDLVRLEDRQGGHRVARLVTLLPGRRLADVSCTDELLSRFGALLGRLDALLENHTGPDPEGDPDWDLDRAAAVIEARIGAIEDRGRRRLVLATAERCLAVVDSLPELPRSVIHGDANDFNVLVDADPEARARRQRFEPTRISGILDFGDALRSTTVNDPAIAAAYCLSLSTRHHGADPVARMLPLVGGYHRERPLSEDELSAIFPKALLRLCVSVCASAHHRALDPEHAYASVSEEDAWRILVTFADLHLRRVEWRLRATCGLEPVPGGQALTAALAQAEPAAVMAPGHPVRVMDLSFEATSLVGHDAADADALTRSISAELGVDLAPGTALQEGDTVGWGRWGEPRPLYVGDQYGSPFLPLRPGGLLLEPRTVHLGVDLFAPAGTPVHACLDGRIHSFADNDLPNDYGPTILLEHELAGRRFLTLHGHLSRSSLEGLEVGRPVAAGETIGRLGEPEVNGGWTPHLHFQIVLDDLDAEGNFPGVGEAGQLDVWRAVCPNPHLLLRWPGAPGAEALPRRSDLWSRRRRSLAPSLSLSYERPLMISRGRGAWLFGADGHRFLDLVNNVAHVGHCHPRVVAALHRQAATLNTNSRYLHRNVVDYAERLLATLPTAVDSDPLEVCFLVNSGSEANDLALRLARAATGRDTVVCMEGAYHGHVTSTIAVSPYKHDGPGGAGTPAHVRKVSIPDTFRGRHRDGDAGDRYAAEVEEAVRSEPVGAFIGEPLLSCGGQIELPEGYLRRAYRAVRSQGGVCIADEVQVGFGRVGSDFWAFQTQGVVPDVVTLGKPIGNGHPLAAVVTTRRIAEAFANGMEYFNTYGGNPVSCAVGLAVLDVIEEEDLQRHARDLGRHFRTGLEDLARRHPCIGDVRGLGLFLGFELVRDPAERSPDADLATFVVEWMRERGFLLSTDGPDHNVVKIKPPMVIREHEVDATLAALDELLERLRRSGAVPGGWR